jgi:lipid II:glycine glycyltransferase (peptidoglycan interpeptide bridge formation enzyme)
MRQATPSEIQQWDQMVAQNPDRGNVLQTHVYGQFKSYFGWRPEYVVHQLGDVAIAVLYLVRTVPLLGELWYAPKGPGVTSTAQLRALADDFNAPRAFMLKVEPDLWDDESNRSQMAKIGFIKAKYDLQWNRSTVVIDLKPSEEDIISGFKQKTRYNIRLAERKGVIITPTPLNSAAIDQMYDLMHATQLRAGFYMRSKDYLSKFWQMHESAGHGKLFFASFEGQILAGVFALYEGKQGLYKDGGSTREHTELQAPYLLQWEVMRWLRDQGCSEYDLHGVPPADRLEDPTHPLAGLAQFKRGFHPDHIASYVGVYDLPIVPSKYHIWHAAGEKLMAGYSFRVKKELYY